MEDNKQLNALSNAVSRGNLSQIALDFLEEHLKALSESVDKRIFLTMNKSQALDVSTLIQAYAEKNAYHNIRSTLLQSRKLGQSSGIKFKKILEKSNGTRDKGTGKPFSTYRG